jgi:hypothetical protein
LVNFNETSNSVPVSVELHDAPSILSTLNFFDGPLVSVSQYVTHTSDQNTCYMYLQAKQMSEKLADHKTTVDVLMFISCFYLEP